jgi:hypothetical protein
MCIRGPHAKIQFLETEFTIERIYLLYGIQQPTVTNSPFRSQLKIVKFNRAWTSMCTVYVLFFYCFESWLENITNALGFNSIT